MVNLGFRGLLLLIRSKIPLCNVEGLQAKCPPCPVKLSFLWCFRSESVRKQHHHERGNVCYSNTKKTELLHKGLLVLSLISMGLIREKEQGQQEGVLRLHRVTQAAGNSKTLISVFKCFLCSTYTCMHVHAHTHAHAKTHTHAHFAYNTQTC